MKASNQLQKEEVPRIPILNDHISIDYSKVNKEETTADLKDDAIQEEILLAAKINHFRTFFIELCHKYLKIDPPRDCFNEFLIQCECENENSDIIPDNLQKFSGERNAIYQDLLHSLPMKLESDYNGFNDEYLQEELKMLQTRVTDFINLERNEYSSLSAEEQEQFNNYVKNIKNYRVDVIPPFKRAEKLPQARLLNYQYVSFRYSSVILDIIEELLAEIEAHTETVEPVKNSDFSIEIVDEKQKVLDIETANINTSISKEFYLQLKPDPNSTNYKATLTLFSKLSQYERKIPLQKLFLDKYIKEYVGKEEFFKEALFLLLRRYQTFSGNFYSYNDEKPKIFEGSQFEQSLPPKLYTLLNNMELNIELCGSGINNYFEEYNSAFYEVDEYFGGGESIFNTTLAPRPGFAYLPSTEEFIDEFYKKIDKQKVVVFISLINEITCEEYEESCDQEIELKPNSYYVVNGNAWFESRFYEIAPNGLKIFCFNCEIDEAACRSIFESPDGLE